MSSLHPDDVVSSTSKTPTMKDDKTANAAEVDVALGEDQDNFRRNSVVSTAKELISNMLHVEDDPTVNPWTFRMFFIGMLHDLARQLLSICSD